MIIIMLEWRHAIQPPRVAQMEMHINVYFASMKGTYHLRD